MRVPPKTRLLRARLRQRAGECSGTRQHRRNDDDLDRRSECFIRSLGGVSATGETPCRAPNSRAHAKRGFSKLLSRWRGPTSVKGKENRVERTPFFRIERAAKPRFEPKRAADLRPGPCHFLRRPGRNSRAGLFTHGRAGGRLARGELYDGASQKLRSN